VGQHGGVRLTDFWGRMERRFGPAYAASYASDQVLQALGGRTVREALAAGEDPKLVWRAVCDAVGAPASER
jgi:hypothetical protein